MLSKKCLVLPLFTLLLAFASCEDNTPSPVPNVIINRSFNIGAPENASLNAVGGYIIVPSEGYGGLIVVRATYEDMYAFDMQCTNDPIDVAGRTTENGLLLECGKCGSQFISVSGQVAQGPASLPLKGYKTSFNGQIVYVTN